MPIEIDSKQKIALVKMIRSYGQRVKTDIGFGTQLDRKNARDKIFLKYEQGTVSNSEENFASLLAKVDMRAGLSLAYAFVEEMIESGDIVISDAPQKNK